MNDLMTAEYFVTTDAVQNGQHFVHSGNCQVLPQDGVVSLGEHGDCEPALAAARDKYAPVNACALCCSSCYTGSDAFEETVVDD